ncbi:hypothetical protein ACU4GI_47070 (plasmid) [Cupriavidus basilensis]
MHYGVKLELPVEIDLPPDIKTQVLAICVEILSLRNRIGADIVGLCVLFCKLKELISNKQFEAIACGVFDLPRGSAWRYVRQGSGFLTTSKGMEDPGRLRSAATGRALLLLDGADADVLTEVRERAMRGESINERQVKELMEEAAALKNRLGEATEMISVHKDAIDAKDNQIKQLENQKNASRLAELETSNVATARQARVDALSAQICGYEAEIKRLREDLAAGGAKVGEIASASDTDAQIANQKEELNAINRQIEEARLKLADAEAERTQKMDEISRTKEANGQVVVLRSEFQVLCEKLSATLLQKSPLLNDESKQAVLQMAENFTALLPTIHQFCRRQGAV